MTNRKLKKHSASILSPDFIKMSAVGVKWERRSAPAATLLRGQPPGRLRLHKERGRGWGHSPTHLLHPYLSHKLVDIYGGGRVGHKCSKFPADSPEFPGGFIQHMAVETYDVSGTALGAEIQPVPVPAEFNFYWKRGHQTKLINK